MSQTELLMGADLRNPKEIKFGMSLSGNIFTVTIVTLIDQIFVVGLVIINLLKKKRRERQVGVQTPAPFIAPDSCSAGTISLV